MNNAFLCIFPGFPPYSLLPKVSANLTSQMKMPGAELDLLCLVLNAE